jgi:hypothetical protein
MEPDYESKPYKVSLPIAVLLIFFILKTTNTGVIGTWNWIWVFSPLWGSYIIKLIIDNIVKLIERWKK